MNQPPPSSFPPVTGGPPSAHPSPDPVEVQVTQLVDPSMLVAPGEMNVPRAPGRRPPGPPPPHAAAAAHGMMEPGMEFHTAAPQKDSPFVAYLRKIGAGSLMLSLGIHLAFILIALFLITFTMQTKQEEQVDFLPGGGGGSNGATKSLQKSRQRQVVMAQPKARITSSMASSEVILPDPQTSMAETNLLSGLVVGGGSSGLGGGVGGGIGTGRGTGRGSGWGPGSGAGFAGKFLGLDSTGSNIMFVIDTSSSMLSNCKPEGIAAIRREMEKSINGMTTSTQFNLICFSQYADVFKPTSVFATAENKKEAINFFRFYYSGQRSRTEAFGDAGKDPQGISYQGFKPSQVKGLEGTGGGSRMDLGLSLAFERQATTVFLLSDGEPGTQRNAKKLETNELIKFMSDQESKFLKGKRAVVNTISVNPEAESFMKKVASRFNGKHKSVDPTKL